VSNSMESFNDDQYNEEVDRLLLNAKERLRKEMSWRRLRVDVERSRDRSRRKAKIRELMSRKNRW